MAEQALIKQIQHKRNKGFTLVEMMVAVAVLSITLVIAVPSFTGLINNNRLTSQANELIAAFILARTEAIKQNQFVVLCHSSNSLTCDAAPSSGWKGWLVARQTILNNPATTILASGAIDDSRFTLLGSPSVSSATDVIRFTPQGLARTATDGALNAVLRVCIPAISNNNVRDVQLRSGGRVRIVSDRNSGCAAPANPT